MSNEAVLCFSVSHPQQVLYNSTRVMTIETVDDVGPDVIHLYEVNVTGSYVLHCTLVR